ncbi:MAG TPA: hypothetical protein VGN57_19155 [Pirellulaceae bacterium]|jgi:hypothetical protein|nr:hypothetical protein [Pirellulaceae bacterium]
MHSLILIKDAPGYGKKFDRIDVDHETMLDLLSKRLAKCDTPLVRKQLGLAVDSSPSSMTHSEKLEAVRQKCVEANPAIEKHTCCECDALLGEFVPCPDCGSENSFMDVREPRLADMLLAYQHAKERQGNWNDNDWRVFIYPLLQAVGGWNLSKDSLDAQSPETISFLYDLLHD